MKAMKRRLCSAGIFLMLVPWAVPALAGGYAATFPLAAGSVDVTNVQANSVWVPVAALVRYDEPTDVTIDIWRLSQGHTYLLSTHSAVAASSAIWIAETDYPFALGDVLRVTSSATNGVMQLIRKGE